MRHVPHCCKPPSPRGGPPPSLLGPPSSFSPPAPPGGGGGGRGGPPSPPPPRPAAALPFFPPRGGGGRAGGYNLGHAIGILCGYGALWLFGLQHAPPAMATGVSAARVGAAALSLASTGALMILLKAAHPPAGATTLIISLGIVTRPFHLLVIEIAVTASPTPRTQLPPRLLPVLYFGAAHVALAFAFGAVALDPRGVSGFFDHARMQTGDCCRSLRGIGSTPTPGTVFCSTRS